MASIIYYDSNGEHLDFFTQWDLNRTIMVSGISMSPIPTFHLSHACSDTAYVIRGDIHGEEVAVPVPNILLQQGKPIVMHAYYEYDDGSSKTEHTIVIPVIPRPKPQDYIFYEHADYLTLVKVKEDLEQLRSDINEQLSWYEF